MHTASAESVRIVLAATDLSPAAEAGLAWAAELARWHGAALHLAHAVPPIPTVLGDQALDLTTEERLRESAGATLGDLAARWRSTGLEVETHTRLGVAWSVLVELAGELPADLVVLATRGHTGLRYLLLGSTSRRVVQRAPCPVLTVHPEQRPPAHRPRTVVLPTDFGLDALAAAEAAERLLGAARGETRFLLHHAWLLPPEYAAYSLHVPPSRRSEQEVVERLRAKSEEVAERLRQHGFLVEARVVEGTPTRSIVELATETAADAVVMPTHGARGFEHLSLGSVAERVVQLAPCPVLTLRPETGRQES